MWVFYIFSHTSFHLYSLLKSHACRWVSSLTCSTKSKLLSSYDHWGLRWGSERREAHHCALLCPVVKCHWFFVWSNITTGKINPILKSAKSCPMGTWYPEILDIIRNKRDCFKSNFMSFMWHMLMKLFQYI